MNKGLLRGKGKKDSVWTPVLVIGNDIPQGALWEDQYGNKVNLLENTY